MKILLKNVRWKINDQMLAGDIRIAQGTITALDDRIEPEKGETVLAFSGHFVYPGLINAHDHLEMNLYPRLGSPPHASYVDWSRSIYKPDQSPVKEIEKVDKQDRLLWGGIKNLISGVTTVAHHNPWDKTFEKDLFPVNVVKKMTWSHSLAFGKNIASDFPKDASTPFIIHAAEGTDAGAFEEIKKLDALGVLNSNTILVHGIALRDADLALIKTRNASIVWCPASNLFMFDKTAAIKKSKDFARIGLGTDSTMTGSPTLLHEMQVAAQTQEATMSEIYVMVTDTGASILKMPKPHLASSEPANLFVAPALKENYVDNLFSIAPADIAATILNGILRSVDASISSEQKFFKNTFSIDGKVKRTDVPVAELKRRIEKKVGVKILEQNPLWRLIEV
jgi:cytosine/adenosine deaminase-related metal-dependent hydrolase